MNIVILRATNVDPDSRVEKEAYSLTRKGHHVHVLGWDREKNHAPSDGLIYAFGECVPITRFGIKGEYGAGMSNFLSLIKLQVYMVVWLIKKRKEYNCIHACDLNTAFTGFVMARILRKKIVYDIFDYFADAYSIPHKLKKIVQKIDDVIIHNADAVIICTEQRIEQIKYHGKKEKLFIIHNSPININDVDFVNNDTGKEKFRIVYVGVLQPDRYIEELLETISNHNEYELHIGGFGPLEPLVKKMAHKYNNIVFYGKLPYKQTLELEKTANIMTALYKYNEAHKYAAPNKFYEALMLGKPLIMARNTGMDSVIIKNKIGKVLGYDADTLDDALGKLCSEKSKWPEIANKMKRLFAEKYSWTIMEDRLLAIYETI